MLILVINCGSSSAKYKLFDMKSEIPLARGIIERIGETHASCKNHYEAVKLIRDELRAAKDARMSSVHPAPMNRCGVHEIKGIGHRVVHGGEEFSQATVITKKVLKSIEKFSELAPLHNLPSLAGIKASGQYFPHVAQVAVFDTAFHQSMPPHAFIYGIPFGFYKKYKIRRFGFHGTSHRFVAGLAAKRLKRPLRRLKLVTLHLGNGCSMAAIRHGKSIDTSMGFTPLEGLLMGTRSGDLDPAVVTFLMEKEALDIKGINELLNKKSGIAGVSGVSNDMRDILSEMKKKNRRAELAFNIFVYRIKKYIGAYQAAMAGLDAVILTGGIGENTPELKQILSRDLRPVLGHKTKFLTIPTNEELLIARDTYRLIMNSEAFAMRSIHDIANASEL